MGSTPLVQQILFSMFPSILTFDFDLILGSFWLFGTQIDYFLGRGNFLKTVLRSSRKAEKLLYSVLPSIQRLFRGLGGSNGLFMEVR